MIQKAISDILNGHHLSLETTKAVMIDMMDGKTSPAQMASFLTAMRMKGETIEEITACAMVLREKCNRLTPPFDVLDIVGTGGDELYTFNISTVSALVIAASGIKVAKHGNRSVSSKCGSADLLEALGVRIGTSVEQCAALLERVGICFMHAPLYHASMKNVAAVRKELGARTLFNIVGPLANPAGAQLQLLGVYDENLVEPLARVLSNLGVKRAMVVHGHDGLDEATLTTTTTVCEINNGNLNSFFITPEQFGLTRCTIPDLVGGDPTENAQIALDILHGQPGAKRDIVLLNTALCMYMSYSHVTLKECVKQAAHLIDSGKALEKLEAFIAASNTILNEVLVEKIQ